MAFFRVLIGLLALASVVCFVLYATSRDPRWRQRGWLIMKWTLIASLGFFAVLIAERLIFPPGVPAPPVTP
ncbi:hypothetical protein MW290_28865 [Aquincola tertiaricarbonis]|uniref:Transmembrane protein n=1 Tax=Aquincola tertiaricarbonis TaxID=391953 RepID=A0ABY4S888_AQUTE|nr:hypothetical protein MW290_28865 [Aquincola tertiaricarbonis]